MASPTVHQPISPNANDPSKAAWMKKLDQEAFIRAQQEAFHAFQIAKAVKLSKETAASEEEKRRSAPPPKAAEPERSTNAGEKRKRSDTVVSFNPVPSTSTASAATPPATSGQSSTTSNATPIPVTAPQTRGRRVSIHPSHAPAPSSTTLTANDDAGARSLARSQHPDNVPQTPSNVSSSPPKSTTVSKTTHHTSTATKSTTPAAGPATKPQPIPNPSSQPSLISTTRPSRSNTIPSSTGTYHYSSSSAPNNHVSKSSTQLTSTSTTPRNEPQASSKREPSATADRERKPSSAIAATSQPAPTAESPNYRRQVDRRQSSSAADQSRPVLSKTDSHKTRSSSNAPFPATGTTPTASEVRPAAPSVQDIQTGMIINPMNVPSHNRRPSVTATPESALNDVRPPAIPCTMLEDNNLFTRSSPCPSCGTLLFSPRSRASIISGAPHASQQFSDLLHLVCSRCSGTCCRGCFQPTSCSSKGATGCSVGLGTSSSSSGTSGRCSLQDCCSTVSIIAIFEALSSFDQAYLAEVAASSASSLPFDNHSTPPTRAQRQGFLKQLISRPDKGTRKLEESFVRTIRILCSWLNQGPFSSDLVDLLCDLFLTSLLLEVIHAFLTHTVSARDWISHSDAYIALLDLLKKMHDAELYTLLNTPIPCIEHSRGLGEWVWNGITPPAPRSYHSIVPPNGLFLYDDDDDDEFELEDYLQNRDHRRGRSQSHSQHRWQEAHATTYFSSSSTSTSTSSSAASSAFSSSASSPRMAYLHLLDDSQVGEPMRNPPLSELILRLETHRRPLMALVGKVQFSATLEKVNILSDGISYLLLQQVVGIN